MGSGRGLPLPPSSRELSRAGAALPCSAGWGRALGLDRRGTPTTRCLGRSLRGGWVGCGRIGKMGC